MIKHLKFFIVLLVFQANHCFAQEGLGKVFGSLKKSAQKLTGQTWEPGQSVSTSIKDTLYGIYWMNDYLESGDATELESFNLAPGYYKAKIRSYCLHAGTYGPTKGSGYQIAPILGNDAKLIRSILEKSAEHKDIPQRNVQTLIWGIEAGTRFNSYPLDFQLNVKPLLTQKDILLMQVDKSKALNKVVPDQLKSAMQTYASLRTKMQSAQLKYDEIESIAVLTGVPPLGAGSKEIREGVWSYIGNGFYLKAQPEGYTKTDIEIYRPAKVNINYNDQNKISGYSYNGYEVKVNYKASNNTVTYNGNNFKIQEIEGYTLTGPESGQTLTVKSNDWYIDEPYNSIKSKIETAATDNLKQSAKSNTPQNTPPSPWDIYEKWKKLKEWYDRYKEIEDVADDLKNGPKPLDDYINDAAVQQNIYDGLNAALNPVDKEGQSNWIRHNLKMTLDMFMYAICQLRGDCDDSNDPKKPGLNDNLAQPGNTSMQRIGLSPYKAD